MQPSHSLASAGEPPALDSGGQFVKRAVIFASCAAMVSTGASAAQPRSTAPPEVFTRVTECRQIVDPTERLACYDRAVAALAGAQARQQVVVVDQEQIRQTRRGLFGLDLPNIGRLFSHEEGLREITAKLRSADLGGNGRWVFTLEDGSVWRATESRPFSREPRAGMQIRIRQAALGSYMANIAGQRAIRVTRTR